MKHSKNRKLRTCRTMFLIVMSSYGLVGCASLPKPGSSLTDVEFSVFPHIVNRNGKYFLQYQINVSQGQQASLVRVVYSDIIDNKAYYYFSIPISHFERGSLIDHPLEEDGFTEFARQDAVYWLNKDQSKIKLKIE